MRISSILEKLNAVCNKPSVLALIFLSSIVSFEAVNRSADIFLWSDRITPRAIASPLYELPENPLPATLVSRAGVMDEHEPEEEKQPEKKEVKAAAKAPAAKAKTGLVMPTTGINWGELHGNNGVDIANRCGTKIRAAAGGTVSSVARGWNRGYGSAVIVEHANGTKTHYAHLSAIHVSPGAEVEQGETIGLMGSTGKSTGCHLHFEVHGGRNPFVK